VLKRYVNFMNNPDERTAVDQFGKGDKYFGVCTLMATLPGLPMFGHGQFEGLAERYGMEYRRAYRDEAPDRDLVARHEREISPLLHRRALFAEVSEFLLYDFFSDRGGVNEDVFAYSNRVGDARALVVYHNRYADTRGWIRVSSAYAEKAADGSRRLRQRTLGEAFGLSSSGDALVAFRDARSGLEHLHLGAPLAEQGLRLELDAYRCHVFLDWREWVDDGGRPWRALCAELGGRGVPSLDRALRALELRPMHHALRALLELARDPRLETPATLPTSWLEQASERLHALLGAVSREAGRRSGSTEAAALEGFRRRLESALRLASHPMREAWPEAALEALPRAGAPSWTAVLAFAALDSVGRWSDPARPERAAARRFDELEWREPLAHAFAESGAEDDERWRWAARVRAAFAHAAPNRGASAPLYPLAEWLDDPDVAWALGAHEHDGVRYVVQELYERLLGWMAVRALLDAGPASTVDDASVKGIATALTRHVEAAGQAGYRIDDLLALVTTRARRR